MGDFTEIGTHWKSWKSVKFTKNVTKVVFRYLWLLIHLKNNNWTSNFFSNSFCIGSYFRPIEKKIHINIQLFFTSIRYSDRKENPNAYVPSFADAHGLTLRIIKESSDTHVPSRTAPIYGRAWTHTVCSRRKFADVHVPSMRKYKHVHTKRVMDAHVLTIQEIN